MMSEPQITYINSPEHLHVRVSGLKTDLEIALQYWNKILIECSEKQFSKLLVERDFPSQLDVFDMKILVRQVAALILRFNIKIAFIEKTISRPGVNEYGINTATGFGATAQIFDSIHEAENWLMSL